MKKAEYRIGFALNYSGLKYKLENGKEHFFILRKYFGKEGDPVLIKYKDKYKTIHGFTLVDKEVAKEMDRGDIDLLKGHIKEYLRTAITV